jgi:DNA-directed RNA polymerase subunit E'/Rpb7
MEHLAVFEEKVALSPMDLRNEINGFDVILIQKLRTKLEGKCSQHGYVVPNSLKLLSRSLGYAEKGRFTGDFLYYVKAEGKVYYPPEGLVVEGQVVRKNKMGLYVILHNAIRIMILRDLHIGNEEFNKADIGDTIQIEIKKSQFQVNDSFITCIGQFIAITKAVAHYEEDENSFTLSSESNTNSSESNASSSNTNSSESNASSSNTNSSDSNASSSNTNSSDSNASSSNTNSSDSNASSAEEENNSEEEEEEE